MRISVHAGTGVYEVRVQNHLLPEISRHLPDAKRWLLVTDDGIPEAYVKVVRNAVPGVCVETFPAGENTKSLTNLERLLERLSREGFDREDGILALGGGVIGDLGGLAAALYMRGIKLVQIPTTLLSMVDASVGGKTAVDFAGIKNQVGCFYPPERVLVDPEVLRTLPEREISCGMAEMIKMAAVADADLFSSLETAESGVTEEWIARCIEIKKRAVEADEYDRGSRRQLNFGHTVGHALENRWDAGDWKHGECVALGMIPMCSETVRRRLVPLLRKYHLPVKTPLRKETVLRALESDKKKHGETLDTVWVETIGSWTIVRRSPKEIESMLDVIEEKDTETR